MVIVIRIYWDLRGFATQIGVLKHGDESSYEHVHCWGRTSRKSR